MNLSYRNGSPHARGAGVAATALALLASAWFAPDVHAAYPFSIGGSEADATRIVKVAPNGDTIIAGTFRGSMDVAVTTSSQAQETRTLITRGGDDVFVARLNPAGQALWVVSGGGVADDTVKDLAFDSSNNIYIVGEFYARAQFGGTALATYADGNFDDYDGYAAKIDITGAWQFARGFGSHKHDTANSLVVLPGSSTIPPRPASLVIGGEFGDRIAFRRNDLSEHTVLDPVDGGTDLYLARMDSSDGEWIWAVGRGAQATGKERVGHLALDADNQVWMIGEEATASTQPLVSTLGSREDLVAQWEVPAGLERYNPLLPWITPYAQPAGINIGPGVGHDGNTLRLFGSICDLFTVACPTGDNAVNYDLPTRAIAVPSSANRILVSLDVQRGVFQPSEPTRSDNPDSGDELELHYFAGGTWKFRYRFNTAADGQVLSLRGAQALEITDPDAMNSNFRLRLAYRGRARIGQDVFALPGWPWMVAVPHPDTYHVTNVDVRTQGATRPVVFGVLNAMSDTAANVQIEAKYQLPDALKVNDLKLSGSRMFLAGYRSAAIDLPPASCGSRAGIGATFVTLTLGGGVPQCQHLATLEGGQANDLVVDAAGHAYATGSFTNELRAAAGQPPLLTGTGSDVFVLKLRASDLGLDWITGGNQFDEVDGIPAHAGGDFADEGNAIGLGPGGNLYVGGSFVTTPTTRALFGESDELRSRGASDGFVFTLGRDGRFPREERWTVGVPLTPPPDAADNSLTAAPDFRVNGQAFDALGQKIFLWVGPISSLGLRAKLIPLQPASGIEVRWRVADEPLGSTNRISSFGRNVWPTHACSDSESNGCYQSHVIGAPVAAEPPSGNFKVLELVNPGSDSSSATYSGGRFTATRTGYSALIYVNGPTPDQTRYQTLIEVVRTVPYDQMTPFVDNVPAEIGRKITDPHHTEPNRTGFVVNELAYYDGFGPDAAYNREARTGAIIPVNRYSGNRQLDQGRELAVAWYRDKSKGVFWPDKVVRYQPYWPIDPPRIIIASEQGTETLGQTRLNPAQFPGLSLYVQNDPGKPGFNPNDEHAFMAPSALGSGFEAVFALRADFGSRLPGDLGAASDPYVLIRYLDSATQERRFRVYAVTATGAGFNQFRYTGVAGTTVSPPYPVRLLPGCAQTFVVGQAVGEQPPPPFFQDYKNQLWAKSAGSGEVQYYYPAQPGFFSDIDNNNSNDLLDSQCVPWLARLPLDQGGTASPTDPIAVNYEIAWPEQTPLLVSGETLLAPKRGLPDIISQAAVEVVFDEVRDASDTDLPTRASSQLIDPLGPRFVRLSQIPSAIASEMGTDGKETILGSSDGTIKLAVSVRDRLQFDPINRRLTLSGLYDPTIAGEPLLLLNVLSKRDRIALKRLDGGDGNEESSFTGNCQALGCSWDQAVEALFRLSRNPNGIRRVCTASHLDDQRRRICDQSEAVNENHVLIGYQDRIGGPDADGDGEPDGDYVLEPFQAAGVSAALSAGISDGNGYVTLAFNNDAALNPLPVSLQVIQVGCLVSPPPPATALINSTYQGQINVISPDNIFDEQLVLRHGGDFGGNPDALEFEWYYHPDIDGNPPMPLPDPATGNLHGWIRFPTGSAQGAVEISIEGANIQTLSDNWYVARYRGLQGCNNQTRFSLWAGQPGATPTSPRAQLASGWVKRVISRLNPFEARVQDFGAAQTNTYGSMMIQLGQRYSGPVALNNDPDNLNAMGLIEAYTTVMRRAIDLSIGSTPPVDYGPANAAILLVASRLVDFYTLLGNEAYADAQDPTIAITTQDGDFSLSPTIFNFQNQLDSLLSEELVLLRGRDTSNGPVAASPVYNRLFWNFTTGDGEIAYALSYNITDQDVNGVIDEFDARILFPQGHGDAWGHYLTAEKIYYDLLRHPFYSWDPRPEAVPVAGVPIQVDFLDERQFAETAARKARAGAEIVDLTYRSSYVADPNGQWQGYEDTDPQRAWGLSEWGRRAGMGAYFDWVTVNAIVPDEDPDPSHTGIQKIERETITHLDEIAGQYTAIQAQIDEADAGLNPLGLAQNVVPFDIDPTRLNPPFNQTQFEQIYERALGAVKNALTVWDYANQLNNQLRRTLESADDLYARSVEEETDHANQLIEIFGYPYADDIGPGGTYPAGYEGPDMYHHMYIDVPVLAGTAFDFDQNINDPTFGAARIRSLQAKYTPAANGIGHFGIGPVNQQTPRQNVAGLPCALAPLSQGCALGDYPSDVAALEVEYTTIESPDYGYWFTKPESWTGERRAPGRLQQILQQMLEARVGLRQALLDYDRLRNDVFGQQQTLQATFNVAEANLLIANARRNELRTLTAVSKTMESAAIVARRVATGIDASFGDAAGCVPTTVIAGLAGGGDFLKPIACMIDATGSALAFGIDTAADGLEIVANSTDAAKEDVEQLSGIREQINQSGLDLYNIQGEIEQMLREEPVLRAEVFARTEAIKQLMGEYRATLAEGQRVLDRLLVFRKDGAAEAQQYRFKDMAFRIFRNDALQKYRASFDLAARYVYLAAAAYDYETNLLGSNSQGGQKFLTNIVRERNLGQILNGIPMPGSPGLADTLAQMRLNFDVLKGQMGFNNPQNETNRFSLRRELFRIPAGAAGDAEWQAKLESARVPDLWAVPEFRRFARPFAPESAGPQPGLVLEFSTNVTFGMNFFGWELGPNDSSYDSSQFATRIRSVGTWFSGYADLPLADDPRIYLFPVGADVLRAPSPNDFTTREWQVLDQAVPIPFPMGSADLGDYAWNPGDTLSGSPTEIRRYARIPAYHYSEPFDESQITGDSRLVGRSVWNRRWLLIIPGGTFLNDPNEGLDTFIRGRRIPGGGNARDGDGVDDIRIFFKTYAYSGQ